jgi:hypothetical protein
MTRKKEMNSMRYFVFSLEHKAMYDELNDKLPSVLYRGKFVEYTAEVIDMDSYPYSDARLVAKFHDDENIVYGKRH